MNRRFTGNVTRGIVLLKVELNFRQALKYCKWNECYGDFP